uniref:Uncharacterized protein n=1 Tax=Arion vulgaris TaxID=1028688 RepID=A0A0B6Y787_9EUPU
MENNAQLYVIVICNVRLMQAQVDQPVVVLLIALDGILCRKDVDKIVTLQTLTVASAHQMETTNLVIHYVKTVYTSPVVTAHIISETVDLHGMCGQMVLGLLPKWYTTQGWVVVRGQLLIVLELLMRRSNVKLSKYKFVQLLPIH